MRLKSIIHSIKNTSICLKYPFLYPRNRFTGNHYNNWKLIDLRCHIYKNYHVFDTKNNKKQGWYFKKIGDRWSEYWKNWWALPVTKLITLLNDYILAFFHIFVKYNELDFFRFEAPGWAKAFGTDMCNDLRKRLKHEKILYSWRITQWKEKNGEMRLYSNFSSKETESIISKYMSKSRHICINCGKEADVITTMESWKRPYCHECYNKVANGKEIDQERDVITGKWKTIN